MAIRKVWIGDNGALYEATGLGTVEGSGVTYLGSFESNGYDNRGLAKEAREIAGDKTKDIGGRTIFFGRPIPQPGQQEDTKYHVFLHNEEDDPFPDR